MASSSEKTKQAASDSMPRTGKTSGGKAKAGSTLKEVAKRAGVSTCTASKILNQKPDASRFTAATLERVQAAARELRYIPSQVGRRLVGSASNTLGVIVKGFNTPVTTNRIGHFIEMAQRQGYLSCMYNINTWGEDDNHVMKAATELLARGVDGLVMFRSMPVSPELRRFLDTLPVPMVFVGWGPSRSAHRVKIEWQAAVDQLAAHLHALGHRQVAYFPSRGQLDFFEHKIRPYERAMNRHGLEMVIDPAWTVHEETTSVTEATRPAVEQFLASGSRATAMLMTNDLAALAAVNVLREAGLNVPTDMSVVGFDNLPTSRGSLPQLTTIAQPDPAAVSQAAFDMLHTLMREPTAQVHKQVIDCAFITGQSTGPSRLTPTRSSHVFSEKE